MNETEKEPLKILDKLPYMSLLCKRIDDIDNAINRGEDGIPQAENLLSDLPSSWSSHLYIYINAEKIKMDKSENGIMIHGNLYGTETRKLKLRAIRLEYTRYIKRLVLDMMDDNNMLFVVRTNVPESEFVDMHDQKEKEE